MKPCDSSLRSEALLQFEGYICTDNGFIFVLVAKGNNIGNSQITKQMKELRLKYEVTLEKLEILAARCYLQFCWVIRTFLHASLRVLLADLLSPLLGNHLKSYIFTQLFTCSFSGRVRLIVTQAFKFVAPIHIKSLTRPQILFDCILARKRNSYTKSYLLELCRKKSSPVSVGDKPAD